jgi:GxxExxY protein
MKEEDKLSKEIIGAAIEVHRHLRAGLLESAYEECLCKELEIRDIDQFQCSNLKRRD